MLHLGRYPHLCLLHALPVSITDPQQHHLNLLLVLLPPHLFSSLTELDLKGNNLSTWSYLEQLSQLPQLTHLRLNGNKLSDISSAVGSFRQLRTLQISGNCINSWDIVGRLDRLQLVEMRMRKRNNPVNCSFRDEERVRQLVIARISCLTALKWYADH
jgi:hypothetical protein